MNVVKIKDVALWYTFKLSNLSTTFIYKDFNIQYKSLSDCSPATGNWQLTVTLLLLRGVQWCPVAEVHGQVQWQTVHPRWQLVGHPPPTNFPFQVPFLRLQLLLLLPFYCLIDLQFSTITWLNCVHFHGGRICAVNELILNKCSSYFVLLHSKLQDKLIYYK